MRLSKSKPTSMVSSRDIWRLLLTHVDDITSEPIHHCWATPIFMVSSFVAGLIFAAVHHVYHTKLDNTVVGSATRQQWPIRYTTKARCFRVLTISDSALRLLF